MAIQHCLATNVASLLADDRHLFIIYLIMAYDVELCVGDEPFPTLHKCICRDVGWHSNDRWLYKYLITSSGEQCIVGKGSSNRRGALTIPAQELVPTFRRAFSLARYIHRRYCLGGEPRTFQSIVKPIILLSYCFCFHGVIVACITPQMAQLRTNQPIARQATLEIGSRDNAS